MKIPESLFEEAISNTIGSEPRSRLLSKMGCAASWANEDRATSLNCRWHHLKELAFNTISKVIPRKMRTLSY